MKNLLIAAALAQGFLMAKGPVEKIVVSGLSSPLEITDRTILKFNPYAGPGVVSAGIEQTTGFIVDWTKGITSAPSETLPRYELSFYLGSPVNGLAYVVKYAYDPASSTGYVYIPGPVDPQFQFNRMRHGRGIEGHWLLASGDWQSFIEPLLRKHLLE